MAHIVVLGAGLGGMPMAYEMRELARRDDTVTVVSNSPRFSFVPSNPWVAVSWRTRKDIEIDIGPALKRKGIEFVPVGAKRVHPAENRIELDDGNSIGYDYLVIATGPKLAFDEVPGLGPATAGGHTQSVCHVDHALDAEQRWQEFVAAPGPIVVGAVQGASCYGPAYEFAMIMDTDLRRRKLRDKVPMTFVTAEPYVGHLGLGGVGDSKGLLESALRERHIKWICNAKTTRVEPGKMFVTEHDEEGKPKKEHELPFRYSMMLPAFKGVDAVFGIEGLTNPRGFILIDAYQRNPKFKNIYSVGVCVAIPPVEATPVPVGAPVGTGVVSTGGIATHTPTEKMFLNFGLRWCSSIRMKPRGLVSPSMPNTASTPLKAGSIIENLNGSACSFFGLPSSSCSATCILPASTLVTLALQIHLMCLSRSADSSMPLESPTPPRPRWPM
jgi:sulfide:quinone oxidoreductase